MSLENSINEQNERLLNELQRVFTINLSITPGIDSWRVSPEYRISAPNADPNPAAMAHELLHIKLALKGFAENILTFTYFNTKNSAFSPEFIAPMNNNLGHFKMINEFVEMGYPVSSFLLDTPRDYFLNGMIYKTTRLLLLHNAGILELCREILEIIHLITGAKLFELYKRIDPSTEVGLHPDLVLGPLREINRQLVDDIVNLLDEWYRIEGADNLYVFSKLDKILKYHNIPDFDECHRVK